MYFTIVKIKKEKSSASNGYANNGILAVKSSLFQHYFIVVGYTLLFIILFSGVNIKDFKSEYIIGFCVALTILFWPFINSVGYLLRNPYVLIINRRGIYSEEEEFVHWKFIDAYKYIDTPEFRTYLLLIFKNKKQVYIETTTFDIDIEKIKEAIQKNAPNPKPEFLGKEQRSFGKRF